MRSSGWFDDEHITYEVEIFRTFIGQLDLQAPDLIDVILFLLDTPSFARL